MRLYTIENGRIRPSKMLSECVSGLLQGRPEFVLIDDQKVAHESILAACGDTSARKQVVIVQGGPGTGKSVVAINLLGTLLRLGRNARYVSKNAAPRAVYEAKLAGTFSKTRISNLFSGSGAFVDCEADAYDVLIVDEAHRLNEKSGLYGNLGDNQIRELIRASRCTVFFVDDDQQVTLLDIGHTQTLRQAASQANAHVTELALSSQFRCRGSDGYLAWLDHTLDIRPTANPILDTGEYDFRVFDDPAQMHALIEQKNRANNRSRVVAGYCWKWPSKKEPQAKTLWQCSYAAKARRSTPCSDGSTKPSAGTTTLASLPTRSTRPATDPKVVKMGGLDAHGAAAAAAPDQVPWRSGTQRQAAGAGGTSGVSAAGRGQRSRCRHRMRGRAHPIPVGPHQLGPAAQAGVRHRHAHLPELRRRGAEDHRGHP